MKQFLFFTVFWGILLTLSESQAQIILISSPDGKIEFELHTGDKIQYAVHFNGRNIIERSPFQLKFDQAPLFGQHVSVVETRRSKINETWEPVAGEFTEVHNHCNEIFLTIREDLFPHREIEFIVRAYNDGVAFRYKIPETWNRFIPTYEDRNWILLMEEQSVFELPGNPMLWVADYASFSTHQESEFLPMKISEVTPAAIIGLPLLAEIDPDIFIAITEADLTDWAGMYLRREVADNGPDRSALVSDLSPLPEGNGRVRIKPGAISPWRVVMAGDAPGRLIESQMINNLNDPCAIEDPSWITPGISAWDHWWSGEVQMNTETIKEYIKLASDMEWEYMLVDWHWYGPPFITEGEWKANPEADITAVNPDVDMKEIINFASERNVKLLLWLLWEHVDRQIHEAFSLYERWGIAGVKIDFMARDDQEMVNWYHKVVKKAAEHHLTVDFHGAYKPTGLSRTWPNLLTREGVLGNEYSKWSARITPDHNVTIPFTRMLAGQMDYTPGAFLNVTPEKFRTGAPAQVMNTRAHQLAMFVVYFSPLTVACDHPDHYRNQPGVEFLKEVPATWDDTRVLAGEVGDYIVMTRKKGNRWFVGAMSDSEEREILIKLDWLQTGNFTFHYFRDAPDSDESPQHIETGIEKIKSGQYYLIKMAPGGGFAGWIE
jgi:alpha-glucosidase